MGNDIESKLLFKNFQYLTPALITDCILFYQTCLFIAAKERMISFVHSDELIAAIALF